MVGKEQVASETERLSQPLNILSREKGLNF